ncbi:MAG: hypothetical protein K6F23_03450 [Solobacterium sp.]|nr:hypothetical protein [Solobacterium sp.]
MKYSIKTGIDNITFLQEVDSCSGNIFFSTREGDRLDLKDQLSKYIFLTLKSEGEEMPAGYVTCQPEDAIRLSRYITVSE